MPGKHSREAVENKKLQEIIARRDKEIKDMILKHASMLIEYKGEYTGVREMRKHIAWYTAGLPHSAELRRRCNEIESWETLQEVINSRL